MDVLDLIRERIRSDNYEFSIHAEREREDEHILVEELEQSVASGEIMPCSFCEGELEERYVQYEYRWEGRLFVFEDVPARVCRQCGEKYFDATVVKAMERAVLNQLEPKRILQVPVFSYPDVVAA